MNLYRIAADGEPVLIRMPVLNFVNDKAGKPVGIYEHIGRRPAGGLHEHSAGDAVRSPGTRIPVGGLCGVEDGDHGKERAGSWEMGAGTADTRAAPCSPLPALRSPLTT